MLTFYVFFVFLSSVKGANFINRGHMKVTHHTNFTCSDLMNLGLILKPRGSFQITVKLKIELLIIAKF